MAISGALWVAAGDVYAGIDQTMADLQRNSLNGKLNDKQLEKDAVQKFAQIRKQLLPIAQAGDPLAQYMVATLYRVSSMLIPLDIKQEEEAIQWASLAEKQKFPLAYMLSRTLDYRHPSNSPTCTDLDTKLRDKPKDCGLIFARYRAAAYAGDVSAMQNMPLLDIQTGNKRDVAASPTRRYLWQRLVIDFSPPADWPGFAAMPEATRQQKIAQRQKEEKYLRVSKEAAVLSLNPSQLAALEQEYRETNAQIKRTIMQWKTRYPDLAAGEHGWY